MSGPRRERRACAPKAPAATASSAESAPSATNVRVIASLLPSASAGGRDRVDARGRDDLAQPGAERGAGAGVLVLEEDERVPPGHAHAVHGREPAAQIV